MLVGLYLLMPLLSPWAERASARDVRGWLLVWLVTTTFPFLRRLWGWLYGAPDYGVTPFLYGECPWNGFGTFHYVSGFIGYMLLGFWFRKFAAPLTWKRTLARAIPLWLVGWLVVAVPFYLRIPSAAGYPVVAPYATAVDLEMSWEFCSLGVALTVMAYFLVIRKFTSDGVFYRCVIRPFSEASFGVYLVHIFILVEVMARLQGRVPPAVGIVAGAIVVFLLSAFLSLLLRRIPRLGRWLVG